MSLAALKDQVSGEEFDPTTQTKLIDILYSYLIAFCALFSTRYCQCHSSIWRNCWRLVIQASWGPTIRVAFTDGKSDAAVVGLNLSTAVWHGQCFERKRDAHMS